MARKHTRSQRYRARIAAESRRSATRQALASERQRQEHSRAMEDRALTARRPTVLEQLLQTEPKSRKLTRLCRAIKDTKACDLRYRTVLSALTLAPWVREPEDFKPNGRSAEAHVRSLVNHLLCAYRTPAFLISIWLDHDQPDHRAQDLDRTPIRSLPWTCRLMVAIAKGESAFEAVKTHCPIELTRRQVHRLLQSPVNERLIHAVRRVQIETYTDDPGWRVRLYWTVKDIPHFTPPVDGTGDTFWDTVLRFFARQAFLDPAQIGPLCDYIAFVRLEAPDTWSMRGRTLAALTRGMHEWHGELRKTRGLDPDVIYKPSGHRAWSRTDEWNGPPWGKHLLVTSIVELLSSRDLYAEGLDLRHCVYSYQKSIRRGICSIWSLRSQPCWVRHSHYPDALDADGQPGQRTRLVPFEEQPSRILTIELNNHSRQVVQIRGKNNRLGTPSELAHVRKWAEQNGLSLREGGAGR